MTNPWFKFYGIEFLADPKIRPLSASKRSCLITLLCYACQTDGTVKNLTEEQLMIDSGINFQGDEWGKTKGVLSQFKKLGIVTLRNGEVTLKNWKKRQENALSGAERQARFRERNEKSNGARYESNAREEKRREEKN